ncbi:hypothetical protein DL93DRAFT_2099158 [Clavulina sp. PMI_390]|nr:hypothetical protein DL93DRAFT_2099158 [Clavulina sp. PMI_390]
MCLEACLVKIHLLSRERPWWLDAFDTHTDALVRVKELLGNQQNYEEAPMLTLLEEIISNAHSFSRGRRKIKKLPPHMADSLDREGTQNPKRREKRTIFATLRLAAFRLIEAGLEPQPDGDTCQQDGSRAFWSASSIPRVYPPPLMGTDSIPACGRHDTAMEILSAGAQYEESLRATDDELGVDAKSKSSAILSYYISRMEAAWSDANESVAYFMLQQALECQRLEKFTILEIDLLASKVLDIGKSLIKATTAMEARSATGTTPNARHINNATAAVRWLQHAFQLAEQGNMELPDNQPQLEPSFLSQHSHIKVTFHGSSTFIRSVLRALARAYFVSSEAEPENLSRAEIALKELDALTSSETSEDATVISRVRWMLFAILKRRHAGPEELTQAFRSILEVVPFNEDNVNEQVSMLPRVYFPIRLTEDNSIISELTALADISTHEFVHRFILFLLLHTKGDAASAESFQEVEIACNVVSSHPTRVLDDTAANACQSFLWVTADKLYGAKKWTDAAAWFSLCRHSAFAEAPVALTARFIRKTALCYIRQGDYQQATDLISEAPENEAATHYLAALTAAHQGAEDEGDPIKLRNAQKLILASQPHMLLNVLVALLRTLSLGSDTGSVIERVTLVRMLKDVGSNSETLVATMLRQFHIGDAPAHFAKARDLVAKAVDNKEAEMISKDIAWLWRTAYNCAVDGCSDWPTENVAELFTTATEALLHVCLDRKTLEIEKFSRWLRALCSTLLAKNRSSDRLKVLAYIEQGIEVIKEDCTGDEPESETIPSYPMDERRWLFTVSYNQGVDCFGAALLDEAKRWFEAASVLSGFLNEPELSLKAPTWYTARILLSGISALASSRGMVMTARQTVTPSSPMATQSTSSGLENAVASTINAVFDLLKFGERMTYR